MRPCLFAYVPAGRLEHRARCHATHMTLRRIFAHCRWAEGDLHEWSALSYPDALHAYAEAEFEKMKQMQADLLGIKNGPRAKL